MGSTVSALDKLTCGINSVRGNVPERSIHRTSSCAFDLSVILNMHRGTRTCCHNWGVASATDRHNEDTAQNGSGSLHIGLPSIFLSLDRERMKIVPKISRGRALICDLIRASARERALGASNCGDCMSDVTGVTSDA